MTDNIEDDGKVPLTITFADASQLQELKDDAARRNISVDTYIEIILTAIVESESFDPNNMTIAFDAMKQALDAKAPIV